jgi:integrase
MTHPAPALWAAPASPPEGSVWLAPDTVVLRNRALREGTDPARLSRFADDRWDLSPALFEDHLVSQSVNFEMIPALLRPSAKYYTWQMINDSRARTMRGPSSRRPAIRTIATFFSSSLQYVLQWFAAQGVVRFSDVTGEMLWDYLDSLDADEVAIQQRYRRITEVRRLWFHRHLLPPDLRLPEAPPWDGEDTRDLIGRRRPERENRTPRISETTMQLLLRWAIRFVEDFSDDILAACDEHKRWLSRIPTRSTPRGSRRSPGQLRAEAETYLDALRSSGQGLPGKPGPDGELEIDWSRLAAQLRCDATIKTTSTGQMVRQSGLPIEHGSLLDTTITARLDGVPWHPRIGDRQVPRLARLLSTACFVVVAYLSGARPGEVLNLRRGCASFDKDTKLWLLEGLYFKGAEDEDGNKIPEGAVRPDPWVVVEPVARAVSVLERLHDSHLLFPSRLIAAAVPPVTGPKRMGKARADANMNRDLNQFTAWINQRCGELGRTDSIPQCRGGLLTSSRFRRTLAWFIRRRPRGLIAASIQYGHAHTRMLQGYAGSYDSGFPDEFAFEDWLFRVEGIAEDEQRLLAGERVSGPAADAYRYRVHAASQEFAGRVLTSGRQTRDLLGNPLLQIHHGAGMTCVLNPATAACQLRGSADDPMVTPDIDDCRPRCLNIARTDRDIDHVRNQAAELAEIVADTMAPPIRHARDQHELDRIRTIIDDHEGGER